MTDNDEELHAEIARAMEDFRDAHDRLPTPDELRAWWPNWKRVRAIPAGRVLYSPFRITRTARGRDEQQ
jgi:hypothetical protein